MEHFDHSNTTDSPDTSRDVSTSASKHTPTPERKKDGMVAEIVRFSLIALIIVLPVRIFIAQPFIVSGASMEQTFSTGEYLIVDQLSYRFESPERGDVVVFRYPKDPSKFFIKRIIGIPGDTIDINGSTVQITNASTSGPITLSEPYVFEMTSETHITEVLGSDEYFVMGDNRDASSDSRTWGVLHTDKIIGRAFLRLFPFTQLEVLPGEYDIEKEFISSK